jgi:hypothetical protein
MIKIKNKIQDWKWSMGNDGKFKRLDVKEWFLTEWNFVK